MSKEEEDNGRTETNIRSKKAKKLTQKNKHKIQENQRPFGTRNIFSMTVSLLLSVTYSRVSVVAIELTMTSS